MEAIESLNCKELANGVVVGDFSKGAKQYVFVRVDGVTRFAVLHPRYPAGQPKGGQFMPKDATASAGSTSWEVVRGRDFRKYFKQWDGHAQKLNDKIESVPKLKNQINEANTKIRAKEAELKSTTNAFASAIQEAQDNINHEKEVKATLKRNYQNGKLSLSDYRFDLKYRNLIINSRKDELAKLQRQAQISEITLRNEIIEQNRTIRRTLQDLQNIDKIQDSKMLYKLFTASMKGRALIGVKDGDEMGAAAAIVTKKDHIYIDFLMTNPKTLIEGKSKGAGTAAIKAVAKKSLESGKGGVVKLWAVDSAVSFYEKVGFTRDTPDDNYMTLSSKAAKKLLGV